MWTLQWCDPPPRSLWKKLLHYCCYNRLRLELTQSVPTTSQCVRERPVVCSNKNTNSGLGLTCCSQRSALEQIVCSLILASWISYAGYGANEFSGHPLHAQTYFYFLIKREEKNKRTILFCSLCYSLPSRSSTHHGSLARALQPSVRKSLIHQSSSSRVTENKAHNTQTLKHSHAQAHARIL